MSLLPFYASSTIEKLRRDLPGLAQRLSATPTWAVTEPTMQTGVMKSDISIDAPPALQIDSANPTQGDAENARRVFGWLGVLSPKLAMDERIWTHLALTTYAEYMSVRWPPVSETVIRRRYLLESRTFAALSRNGIARLWWAGYLTHQPSRANPYELTDVLFLRQDIQVGLLERAIGKCSPVRVAVLEYFKENQDLLATEAFGTRIQVLLRELNRLGGAVLLDAVPQDEIQAFLERIALSFDKADTP